MAKRHSFDFPRQACAQSLAARFEEIAREVPGRLALRHGARSVMYDELNRQSNRLAHALLGKLTGQDATILLLLRDPIRHVVAQLPRCLRGPGAAHGLRGTGRQLAVGA